jgi:Hydrolytic ATP binding site of dynein motor region
MLLTTLLQALFRPVAMMVPDYALIGEIMFFAYGFSNAKACGKSALQHTHVLCTFASIALTSLCCCADNPPV